MDNFYFVEDEQVEVTDDTSTKDGKPGPTERLAPSTVKRRTNKHVNRFQELPGGLPFNRSVRITRLGGGAVFCFLGRVWFLCFIWFLFIYLYLFFLLDFENPRYLS